MNKAQQTLRRSRTPLARQQGRVCCGAIAIGAVALQQRNRVEFNAFLISKGIDPEEYYCPESYEEKNA